MDENLRVIDLIPRRWSTLLGLFIAAVAIIVVLEGLYAITPQLVAKTTDGSVAAFDLEKEGSIGAWYSSMLLFMAAAVSLLVYTIRRNFEEDHHNYFRVWLWAAACFMILSIDESASLHEGFKELMPMLTGTRLMGDGSLWWVIPYFFLLVPVGLRLLIDMRECRKSATLLVASGVAMSFAVVAHLNFIFPHHVLLAQMIEEGVEMLGFLFLLSAVTVHARYLIMQAEGEVEEYETDEDEYEYVYEYEEDEADEDEYIYDEDELAVEEAILFNHPIKIRPPHGFSPQKPKLKGKKYSLKQKPAKKKANAKAKKPRPRKTISMQSTDAFTAGMQAAEKRCGRSLTTQEKEALRMRIQRERRERGA